MKNPYLKRYFIALIFGLYSIYVIASYLEKDNVILEATIILNELKA